MIRSGKVYYQDEYAGRIWQDENGYWFAYDEQYVTGSKPPVSLTLPARKLPYHNPATLLPFFDGLIPEGWLLEAAIENWKLNPRDRMGLLLATCRDCIGAFLPLLVLLCDRQCRYAPQKLLPAGYG